MANERTTEDYINEPLAAVPLAHALSDYMMAAFGRRPTRDEMWDIYWVAVDAIEQAVKHG